MVETKNYSIKKLYKIFLDPPPKNFQNKNGWRTGGEESTPQIY